jgi:hypothetical protein
VAHLAMGARTTARGEPAGARRQGSQNRWKPVRFDRFPVEPVRPGT